MFHNTFLIVAVYKLLSPLLCLQVLQGAQLIAVASAEPASGGVDGSPLQGSDIQVQYVQLTPVTDHSATSQVCMSVCVYMYILHTYIFTIQSTSVETSGR